MKVLLLHPEDRFEDFAQRDHWDLVVDLGQAPGSCYQRWSEIGGCRAVSVYQNQQEVEDLHRTRELLQLGAHQMVDGYGIDWWDVLSLMIVPELQEVMLLRRVAGDLPPGSEVYASRPCLAARALQALLHRNVTLLENKAGRLARRVKHYRDVLRQLDGGQVAQVLKDKFDGNHTLRRRLAGRVVRSTAPVVLLPSAYINVSRTAVAYAAMAPDQQFLLVIARENGKLPQLPANVRSYSLDPYFAAPKREELSDLVASWDRLRSRLGIAADEFSAGAAAGLLQRMPDLIRWGIAIRDAWTNLFAAENIVSCLSADDTNPYTRVPLILAAQRGLPTLACHHGALDARMAFKTPYANYYLTKNEMERDYLVRLCRVKPEKVLMGGPHSPPVRSVENTTPSRKGNWLVFFSEPYGTAGWRSEEVYRELLPRLISLAQKSGLKLVFKLHPFESVKGHRRLLLKLLGSRAQDAEVIAGPPSAAVWQNIRCAITVQSTVAMECAAFGIPVFLCGWLRDPFLGYQAQFARFDVGRILNSVAEIDLIPSLLESSPPARPDEERAGQFLTPKNLRALLSGASVASAKAEAVTLR